VSYALLHCGINFTPMSKSRHRSFARITRRGLRRLADIATADFQDLFARKPYSRPYSKRLGLICLCQGAATHSVDVHRDRRRP
jgi:hypothetical protein